MRKNPFSGSFTAVCALAFAFGLFTLPASAQHTGNTVPVTSNIAALTNTNTNADTATDPVTDPAGKTLTLKLSKLGDYKADKNRTRQVFPFDNADYTGFYIRPGIKAQFKINVTAPAGTQVEWTTRQAGQVDTSGIGYKLAGTADRTKTLQIGENLLSMDTTANKVGFYLLLRNNSRNDVSVVIENMAPLVKMDAAKNIGLSLGNHLYYIHDPKQPEKFWDYLQELREYAKTADTGTGDLVGRTDLNMNATGLLLGRSMFDLRASKLDEVTAKIKTKEEAAEYIQKAYSLAQDRLAFFDRLQGFDANDPNPVHHPSEQRVVLELTANISSPSTMYAWYNYYHLPENTITSLFDGTGLYGWANSHEFGHILDINTLVIMEETNNLFSLAGRRLVAEESVAAGADEVSLDSYHPSVKDFAGKYDKRLVALENGETPEEYWGNIWYDVLKRYEVGQFFNNYDYSEYDFAAFPEFTRERAEALKKYGTLGAVYRLIREDAQRYEDYTAFTQNNKRQFNAMVRVYSDATGFNMADVFTRYGMDENIITPATKEYAQKYPIFTKPIEYFTINSDLQDITNKPLFNKGNADVNLEAEVSAKNDTGTYKVTAKIADATLADTILTYELLEDGKHLAYAKSGEFKEINFIPGKIYSVSAYDRRLNSRNVTLENPETPPSPQIPPAPNTETPEAKDTRASTENSESAKTKQQLKAGETTGGLAETGFIGGAVLFTLAFTAGLAGVCVRAGVLTKRK